MNVLSVHNLIYGYSKGTPFEKGALNGVSADFEKGKIIALIGHTGSGKSTLLQMLNALLKPDEGTVLLNGEDIHRSKKSVRECRFKVGLCFQYPEHQLFEATVFDDIAFGPKNMKLSQDEIKQRVLSSMQFTCIPESYSGLSPFDLSGGEKRRVAIAGVLAMQPEVLILDEPTAGLDPSGRRSLLKLIKDYNRTTGSTVIFVSHNMDDVALIADRVIVMNKGEIALSGSVDEVYSKGEMLSQLGLDVPEITSIFLKLKSEGFDLPDDVYTVERGADVLLSLIRKGGGCNGK